MQRTWPTQKSVNDIKRLFNSLRQCKATPDGPYTFEDQKRDFWNVFNGESDAEAGRRVLSQILDICEGPPISPLEVKDHATLASRAGMKWVFSEITRNMAGRNAPVQENINVD